MVKQTRLGTVVIVVALLLISCQTTAPSQNSKSNGVEKSQSSPSNSSSATPAATPCPVPSLDATRKIVLIAPCDGTTVAQRGFVEGLVADSNAEVSVIIHPIETSDYWVQPNVTVREGGRWKVLCYFGERGAQHSGRHYEVMALILKAKGQLKEGQLFHNWPPGQSKSQVIEVVRE